MYVSSANEVGIGQPHRTSIRLDNTFGNYAAAAASMMIEESFASLARFAPAKQKLDESRIAAMMDAKFTA